jgi:uncharacterized protein
MQIQYLEIVTKKVGAVCATYAATNGVQFGESNARLSKARTAFLNRLLSRPLIRRDVL